MPTISNNDWQTDLISNGVNQHLIAQSLMTNLLTVHQKLISQTPDNSPADTYQPFIKELNQLNHDTIVKWKLGYSSDEWYQLITHQLPKQLSLSSQEMVPIFQRMTYYAHTRGIGFKHWMQKVPFTQIIQTHQAPNINQVLIDYVKKVLKIEQTMLSVKL